MKNKGFILFYNSIKYNVKQQQRNYSVLFFLFDQNFLFILFYKILVF